MMKFVLQGLILGFAYVAPIGMQNLYVINTAIKNDWRKALKVALITIFFDISLALACFFGIGLLIERFSLVKELMLLVGFVAVSIIGIKLITSKPVVDKTKVVSSSFFTMVWSCFLVTWLNPQAIIDGSMLLGGYRASLPDESAQLFIFGVAAASFLWFTGLAVVVSLLKQFFNETVLRRVNILCGVVILYFGLKMGLAFLGL